MMMMTMIQTTHKAHTISKTVQTDSDGHAVPQGSPRFRPLTAEAWFQSQVSQCGICGGQSGTENCSPPRTSAVPCQGHVMLHTHPSFIDNVVKQCTWCTASLYTHERNLIMTLKGPKQASIGTVAVSADGSTLTVRPIKIIK
jgi:hypothetical protein